MTWVKIEDQFPDHPKVVAAGRDAAWLYLCGLCYCSRYLTDGTIPKVLVTRLADVPRARHLAARLVDVGLWDDDGERYVVHDYLNHQRSAERVADIKQMRSKAGAKGGAKPKQPPTNGQANEEAKGTPESRVQSTEVVSSSSVSTVSGVESDEEDEYLEVWQTIAKHRIAGRTDIADRSAWLAATERKTRAEFADEAMRLDAKWVLTRSELVQVLESGVEQSAILRYARARS